MLETGPPLPLLTSRVLGHGDGWRATEVTCRCGPATPTVEERHDWLCVAAVLDGMFAYRSREGRALMVPGSLLLGSAGACFEYGHQHGAGDRCLAFHFAPDLVEQTIGGFGRGTRAHFANATVPPLARLLPVLAQTRVLAATPDNLRAEQLALDVLAAAIALEQDKAEGQPTAREERCVASTARTMGRRYAERLTIAELAREAGLSRRRFAAVFRRVLRVWPYQYLLSLRLDSAAACLATDRHSSILDVAADVGFGDLSEFTRTFGARFRMPPGKYRAASLRNIAERSAELKRL